MKKIELLAPAKDLECGIAAIKCGADAVYIGADKFGARSSAGNDIESIGKLVDFAHFYNSKVYVTINTIMDNDEIEQAVKLIYDLYEVGVDAFIIQDMGILEFDLPPAAFFASTQTHNADIEKIKFLEKVGFQRVILARELSVEQIKNISDKTDIELESFVHGALCVSYSGQCYLSYAIGGRSGNRGECAQPCRKKYSLKTSPGKFIAQNKHLLSLKDLNLSQHISEMIDSGITSFKIEGRLKDINYVKNIVSYYNQEINKVLADKNDCTRASNGISTIDFNPDPYKTFNRGYSDYFIKGRKKTLASFDTSKSMGEYIGKVAEVKNNCFKISSNDKKLNNGDGICFSDESGNLSGTTINKVEGNYVYPNEIKLIKQNLVIYRNYDHEFLKKLKNSNIERKISLRINIFQEDDRLIFKAFDENNYEATQIIKNNFDLAQNSDMALNNIKKQFAKLGDTPFICEEVNINVAKMPFIPVKTLNEIRRTLIDKLTLKRNENYQRKKVIIEKNNYPYPEKNLNFTANVLNTYAESFYIRHGVELVEPAAESGIDLSDKTVMTTKYCLKHQFNLCPKVCFDKNQFDVNEKLYLTDEKNAEYLLDFDCKNCEMKIIL